MIHSNTGSDTHIVSMSNGKAEKRNKEQFEERRTGAAVDTCDILGLQASETHKPWR